MHVKCPFCNAVYRDVVEMDSIEEIAEWTDAYVESTADNWQRVLFCTRCCHASASADCAHDNSSWMERLTAKTKFVYQWPLLTFLVQSGSPIGSLGDSELLMELWNLGNQYYRDRASVRRAGNPWDDPMFVSSIRRLAAVLSADEGKGLLAAEVHRELGEFDICRRLLDELQGDQLSEFGRRRWEAISKECERGNRVVVKL